MSKRCRHISVRLNPDDPIDEEQEYVREYPVKLQVDGYEVNHYYDEDVSVYEVYDENGNVMDVAHSTNELHEITHKGG